MSVRSCLFGQWWVFSLTTNPVAGPTQICTRAFKLMGIMPSMSAIGVLNGSYEEQDLLQAWLLVVASLRALSVFLGYFAPMQMLPRVFGGLWSGKEKEDDAPNKAGERKKNAVQRARLLPASLG